MIKTDIREYVEGMSVEVDVDPENNRYIVRAYNEAGFNQTAVDLKDTLLFVRNKLPALWKSIVED